MYVFLLFIAVPILLCMCAWVVLTVHRICFAPRQVTYRADRVLIRRQAEVHEVVPVGVREIRENQRRVQQEQPSVRYSYSEGYSQGVPSVWIEEIWRRRN